MALAGLAACSGRPAAPERPVLVVAAASDLNPAFTEAGRRFEAQHRVTVSVSFGSTGHLSKQIENGAPFDVFAAASAEYVEGLAGKGLVLEGTSRVFAEGYLAIWQPSDAPWMADGVADLDRPEIRRIAIANPQHAPYGRAAEQALRAAGLWERLQPKIIFGETVTQALQFAATGNADAAVVALSISQRPGGRQVPVDRSLYTPLRQSICVLKSTRQEALARAFIALIAGADGRALLRRYGFGVPPEGP